MTLSRPQRVLRGSLAAAVATFTALLFHVAGGGASPAALGVLAPLVLSTAVCTLLAGRRMSLLRLSASVAVSQLLFHGLFLLGTPSGFVTGGGHVHHGVGVQIVFDGAAASDGGAMTAAHALAAAVTVAALHCGERVLAALRALARRVVVRVIRLPMAVDVAPPRASAPEIDCALLPLGVHLPSLRRRGPPALAPA
jgi:hypothetical protein